MEHHQLVEQGLQYLPNKQISSFFLCCYSLLCLKRGTVIEADKSISAQVRTWSLSEGSPYETLHDYVANGFAPYFKAYVKETGKIER